MTSTGPPLYFPTSFRLRISIGWNSVLSDLPSKHWIHCEGKHFHSWHRGKYHQLTNRDKILIGSFFNPDVSVAAGMLCESSLCRHVFAGRMNNKYFARDWWRGWLGIFPFGRHLYPVAMKYVTCNKLSRNVYWSGPIWLFNVMKTLWYVDSCWCHDDEMSPDISRHGIQHRIPIYFCFGNKLLYCDPLPWIEIVRRSGFISKCCWQVR